MERPLMSAKAPASFRPAPASVVTNPAGVTTSSGRAAKSSKVPSTSRKRATEASLNGATSPDVAPSMLGAFNWFTRTAPDAPFARPKKVLGRQHGDGVAARPAAIVFPDHEA